VPEAAQQSFALRVNANAGDRRGAELREHGSQPVIDGREEVSGFPQMEKTPQGERGLPLMRTPIGIMGIPQVLGCAA